MPFCRKCGRRLLPYSKKCTDCGTSTTASLIKIKAPTGSSFKAAAKTKVATVVPAAESTIPIKVISPAKPAKAAVPWKTVTPDQPVYTVRQLLPPVEEQPKHEIKQSKLSIEEDIITNPHDYETQTFEIDLNCPHSHFFAAGSTLPVSKGKAYCPICGEHLRKNERRKRRRSRGISF